MAYYGRRVTAGDTDMGTSGFSGSNQRGQIFAAMPQHGWGIRMGMWAGKQAGQPNIVARFGLWESSGSTIGSRVAYTNQATISAVMSYGGDGADQQASFPEPVMMWQGTKYGLGFAQVSGVLNWAMKAAAKGPTGVADYYFHKRGAASNIPTNPFNAAEVTYEGAKDIYVEYEPNVAPTVSWASMQPTGTIQETSPQFTASFADANTDRGDKIKQSHIQLREQGDTALLWDSIASAGPIQQNTDTVDRPYTGAALSPGDQLEWRYRVSDQFGVWSGWSDWRQFTISPAGSVSVAAGTPTGKQETKTPGPFTGVWSHQLGLSTNAIQVGIYQGGQLVRVSPPVTKSVSPGNTISVSWAEMASDALDWGQSYTYRMRARDTNNVWSTLSAERAFFTNAHPTTPSNLTPNGQVLTSYPRLTCQSSDPDDTPATGFVVQARLKDDTGIPTHFLNMTYNAGANRWEYQLTGTHLPDYGQYSWDAIAADGTVTSSYSPTATFTYAEGPAINIISPANGATLVTNTPTIQFDTTEDVTQFRVYLIEQDELGNDLATVYDSGVIPVLGIAGVDIFHEIPSGYMHNHGHYRFSVWVQSDLGLSGWAPTWAVTLEFPAPPGPANLQASPVRIGNDVTPSAVLVSWQEPSFTVDEFAEALVTRKVAGQPDSSAIILKRLTSTAQTLFYDYYPVSGVNYVYDVRFIIRQGTDLTESDPVGAEALVQLDHVTINDAYDGTKHVGLRYGQPLRIVHNRDKLQVKPWGQMKPHVFIGHHHDHIYSSTFELQNDAYSSGMDDRAALLDLHMHSMTVCIRDQFGNRYFGVLDVTEELAVEGMVAKAVVSLMENDFTEGADV